MPAFKMPLIRLGIGKEGQNFVFVFMPFPLTLIILTAIVLYPFWDLGLQEPLGTNDCVTPALPYLLCFSMWLPSAFHHLSEPYSSLFWASYLLVLLPPTHPNFLDVLSSFGYSQVFYNALDSLEQLRKALYHLASTTSILT